MGLLELGIVTTLLAAAGEGKTTWSFQFFEGAAGAGRPCLGLFPEDPRAMLADRLLSKELGVGSFALRRGRAPRESVDRLPDAVESLSWTRLVDVDDGRYPTARLTERIDTWMADHPGGLVVADYAQAMLGKMTGKNREETISDWIWDMGERARERGCAVVLMSQVRGEVMERGRKIYDQWRWKNPEARDCPDEAVSGFAPAAYDGAQAPTAIFQKSRCVLSTFRPNYWKRQMRWNCKDDVIEMNVLKSNYSPASAETARFGWNGGRIVERT